jgi:nucleotide sugar dehydrogenase
MNNIGIVGVGKLGICYAIILAKAGYKVFIYDINISILDNIKNDTYNYNEEGLNELISKYKSNIILEYNLINIYNNCDIIFTYIQTPSLENGLYNHTYIDNFIDETLTIENNNVNEKLIIINSTVIPEYCNSIKDKLKSKNFSLCYNPSFIAQGSIINNIINPDIVLIGIDDNIDDDSNDYYNRIIEIYNKIFIDNDNYEYSKEKYKKMNLLEAEITKLSINCFITTKITYANMIGDYLINKNCNPDIVLNAIGSDSRIGNKYINYGFGYGGPCLPRDNKALYEYGKINNYDFNICNINDNNNSKHLYYQYEKLKESTEPIEFRYITYKDNSDILEKSQKLELAILLANNKNKVIIYERPYIIEILKNRYNNLFEYKEIKLI